MQHILYLDWPEFNASLYNCHLDLLFLIYLYFKKSQPKLNFYVTHMNKNLLPILSLQFRKIKLNISFNIREHDDDILMF